MGTTVTQEPVVHQQTPFRDNSNRETPEPVLEFLEEDAKEGELQNPEENTLLLRDEIYK